MGADRVAGIHLRRIYVEVSAALVASIVLAGLFLISVLPVVIPAIWAGEGPRRAAQAILYVMLGGQRVSYGEIAARHAETAGPSLADERNAGSATASPRE